MDRQQFIDAHKHELAGLVLDGAVAQRSGADLALFVRAMMRLIDAKLGALYDQLRPPEPLPANGTTAKTHHPRR